MSTYKTLHEFGMDEIIYEYLLIGISQRKIAKLLQVDRNTLNRFIKRSSIINELKISVKKRVFYFIHLILSL